MLGAFEADVTADQSVHSGEEGPTDTHNCLNGRRLTTIVWIDSRLSIGFNYTLISNAFIVL